MNSENIGNIILLIVFFFAGVYITRWIFGIDKMLSQLIQQNEYAKIQIRLLKKMLMERGIPNAEIDGIIKDGNKIENEKI